MPALIAMIFAGALAGFAIASEQAGGQSENGGDASSEGPPPAAELPPIATFAQHCARCHGPRGSFYGDGFADHGPEELDEIVREMLLGPAGLTPTDADVHAMSAYHRALAGEQPFIVVTNLPAFRDGDADQLEGQVDDRAELTASVDGEELEVRKTGQIFRVTLQPDQLQHLKLSAKLEEQPPTELRPAKAAWSHRPKPDSDEDPPSTSER